MEKLLDTYRIESKLAHSSLCTVYRATDENLGRSVLIKMLHPSVASDEEIRKRFAREAQVCAMLKHENIVDVYRYDPNPEQTLLVLEYVDGLSLGELLHIKGRIPYDVALSIMHLVLKGLTYAHSKEVVHRDIKPDNILISYTGQVKIADFGLATQPNIDKITQQGQLVGTPLYISPEQISGQPPDQRSDLYSLGVTFYEILTGQPPFRGENTSELLKNILSGRPPRPAFILSEIPPEIDQLVMRLLERNPNQRFASAAQTLFEVERIATQLNIKLSNSTIAQFIGKDTELKLELPPKKTSKISHIDLKRPVPIWSIVLVGIISILIFLFMIYFINPNSSPTTQLSNQLLKSLVISDKTKNLTNKNIEKTPVTSSEQIIPKDTTTNNQPSIYNKYVGPIRILKEVDSALTSVKPPSAFEQDLLKIKETTNAPNEKNIPAKVTLSGKQWFDVIIDDTIHHHIEFKTTIELEPGSHILVFTHLEFPQPVVKNVNLKPGEQVDININLDEHFGQILITVKPWAEIFVDGKSYGLTPRKNPIVVTYGKHIVELKNPAHKVWRREVTIRKGEPPLEINAILDPL